MSDLPKEFGDREYQSYESDPAGKVAKRIRGSAYLTDHDGNTVFVKSKDGIQEIATVDTELRNVVKDIRREAIKIRELLEYIFA